MNGQDDSINVDLFLEVLGQCEGAHLEKKQIINTISRLVVSNKIQDPVKLEFANRWMNMYPVIISSKSSTKLVACDFKSCEARCCYDGVYLVGDEEEKIKKVAMTYPQYFSHLLKEFIVDGHWGNSIGRKTAVRYHKYKSPDYPKHFEKTRCVFAYSDRACSLQSASLGETGNGWEFKPMACKVHPLQTNRTDYFPPPSTFELDKNDLGVNYPGYSSYTPCVGFPKNRAI